MADQVTIDLEKPENLKDGFNVSIKETIAEKTELDISALNLVEAKAGKQVSIPNLASPKVW